MNTKILFILILGKLELLEGNLVRHKEISQKNLGTFKAKMATNAVEKKNFQEKIANLEQEISSLKNAQPVQMSSSTDEETEKLKALVVSYAEAVWFDLIAKFAAKSSLESERDNLKSAMEALTKASTATEAQPTPPAWEGEKSELVKAREEAMNKLKVRIFKTVS